MSALETAIRAGWMADLGAKLTASRYVPFFQEQTFWQPDPTSGFGRLC